MFFWLLQKHRINTVVLASMKDSANPSSPELLEASLPPTSVLIDQCRQQYALVTKAGEREQIIDMTRAVNGITKNKRSLTSLYFR